MPEKHKIQYERDYQAERTYHPNDEGEQHGEDDDRLFAVRLSEGLHIQPELLERGVPVARGVFADRNKIGLEDGPQRERIDYLTGSFSKDDSDSTCSSKSAIVLHCSNLHEDASMRAGCRYTPRRTYL